MNCFLCKQNNFELKYSLKTKKIFRCKNDGLYLVGNGRDHSLHYGKDYFLNQPNLSNQSYFLSKLRKIQKITGLTKPKILDVGCGWGDFEEVLEKEKIPYLGIDANKEAIKICRKKNLNCNYISIKELLKVKAKLPFLRQSPGPHLLGEAVEKNGSELSKITFDAITLFQVIEHLEDPLPTLQAAKKLLKKNGVLLITTPNNDSPLRKIFGPRWSVYNEPSHFVFFNKETFKKTLKKAGLTRVKVKTDSWRFLSLAYISRRLKNMNPTSPLATIYKLLTTINFPLPTDPFGDLEAAILT